MRVKWSRLVLISEAIIETLTAAIASVRVVASKNILRPRPEGTLPFPAWSVDGYCITMYKKPSVTNANYKNDKHPQAYKNVKIPAELSEEVVLQKDKEPVDWFYYVEAVAMDKTGHEYKVYLGTYKTILGEATLGRPIIVREYALAREARNQGGEVKGGTRSKIPMAEIDALTREWRLREAKRRDENIV